MTVTEVALKNHPGLWLAPDAAASLERFEAAHGKLTINSAGRSYAEQDALLKRWAAGGAANRPPYLYQPAAHGVSWHETGEALDTPEIARFKRDGAAYGWTFDIASDVVHAQYHPAKDTHKTGTTPAGGTTAGTLPYDETVKNEQAWLISLGYDLGPAGADGRKGPKTVAAFKAYQQFLRAYGYTGAIDGVWGAGTQAAHAIYYNSKHAQTPPPASTGAALSYLAIQTRLKQLGFYKGALDGIWGAGSHKALGAFQLSKGLVVDYLVGPKTRAALGI